MNKLLGKARHSTASGHVPGEDISAPRTGKTRKLRLRWMLATLLMPPLATALSLLGTGIAHADGPPYSTSVVCDSRYHYIQIDAGATAPAYGGYVAIQPSIYSYQTGKWYPSAWSVSHFITGTYRQFYPQVYEPAGRYAVKVQYVWYASDGSYLQTWVDQYPGFSYTQYQPPWSGYTLSATCYV